MIAITPVLRFGKLILDHEAYEPEWKAVARVGVRHASGLNSGADALVIGLRAVGVG